MLYSITITFPRGVQTVDYAVSGATALSRKYDALEALIEGQLVSSDKTVAAGILMRQPYTYREYAIKWNDVGSGEAAWVSMCLRSSRHVDTSRLAFTRKEGDILSYSFDRRQ